MPRNAGPAAYTCTPKRLQFLHFLLRMHHPRKDVRLVYQWWWSEVRKWLGDRPKRWHLRRMGLVLLPCDAHAI